MWPSRSTEGWSSSLRMWWNCLSLGKSLRCSGQSVNMRHLRGRREGGKQISVSQILTSVSSDLTINQWINFYLCSTNHIRRCLKALCIIKQIQANKAHMKAVLDIVYSIYNPCICLLHHWCDTLNLFDSLIWLFYHVMLCKTDQLFALLTCLALQKIPTYVFLHPLTFHVLSKLVRLMFPIFVWLSTSQVELIITESCFLCVTAWEQAPLFTSSLG